MEAIPCSGVRLRPDALIPATGLWLLNTLCDWLQFRESTGEMLSPSTLLLQADNLFLLLAAMALFQWLSGRVRWLGGVLYLGIALYLLVDQAAYPYLNGHLCCSQAEESLLGLLWLGDSLWAVLDGTTLLLATVALPFLFPLLFPFRPERRGLPLSLVAPVLLLALGIALLYPTRQPAIASPFAVLFRDCLQDHGPATAGDFSSNPYLAGTPELPATAAPPTSPVMPVMRSETETPLRPRRRNLVFIVLESIGSLQLMPDGLPDPEVTPNLAALARQGLTADAVYAPYPATIVTNIALTTGGHSLTWGKVAVLDRPYRGPTLVGELKRHGYRTALYSSADLEFGNLAPFFSALPWDRLWDFGRQRVGYRTANHHNSWGGNDATTLAFAADWALKRRQAGEPFYLRVQTNLAHHPYNIPGDAPHLVAEPQTEHDDYLNALHYLDHLLGRFLDRLEETGLLGETLIAVTGDHGEAFARRHSGNLVHRNFLYEENVRSFLILRDPDGRHAGERYRQPAASGDLMPTLLRELGFEPPAGLGGHDLLASTEARGPVFFHKNNHPESWGLRSGRWKFISTFNGDRVELYDLERDSAERNNLAARHPDLVRRFSRLCARWYVEGNRSFLGRLEGGDYEPVEDYRPEDFASFGPKVLQFGLSRIDGTGLRTFTETGRFNPREQVQARVKWVNYREPTEISVLWRTPTGAMLRQRLTVDPEEPVTLIPCPASPPLPPGSWRLSLLREGKPLISGGFLVEQEQPPRLAATVSLLPSEIELLARRPGREALRPVTEEAPLYTAERLRLRLHWPASASDRRITLRWRAPDTRLTHYDMRVRAGTTLSVVDHRGPYPMQPGLWWLSLWEGENRIGARSFRVEAQETPATQVARR